MILADAGPLVALADPDEPAHAACSRVLTTLHPPMLTTWPVYTEAMYLLGRGGWDAQDALWALTSRGDLLVADIEPTLLPRVRALMERYRDIPMDLADASLVVLAEARDLRQVFTLDGDFATYRLHGRQRFEILP